MDELIKSISGGVPLIIVAVVTGLSTILVSRSNKKGARELAYANSLQANVKQLDEKVNAMDLKIEDLRKQKRLSNEYIYILRKHINDGKKPPAPDIPVGLNF